ncbi:MAG: thiamine-monophosphate kinase, partial [Verrucomicrobia bacterium]|nr:thiamine-monophosphate kinase [Verrucomicrobiota bacterium]
TLAANPQAELSWLRNIYRGLRDAAETYQINLVGGETARSPGPLFISVALTGKADRGRYATRSGGKPGDCLYVTGQLGGSLKGKHLKFRPRLSEGRWLVRHLPIRAMMDLSDGLASDLPRLAASSRVGFEIELSEVPVTRGCTIQDALRDGEDYELLFAVPFPVRTRLERDWPHHFPKLTMIGRLVEAGERTELGEGYDHFGSS